MLDQAMPNDILFSTTPPYHSTLPPRMIHHQGGSNLKSEYSEALTLLAAADATPKHVQHLT